MAKIRRNRKNYLTFERKLEIIERKKSGVSKEDIIREFDLPVTSYYDILRNAAQIVEKSTLLEFKNKKSKRSSPVSEMERILIKWFVQKRDSGYPVTGPILQEKAALLNESMNGPSNFKASAGWLYNFKKRYGIRLQHMKGGELSLSNNNEAAAPDDFKMVIREKIEREDVRLENVYSGYESGCEWRVLQNVSLASFKEETSASGRKRKEEEEEESKERFTALFCSNASGTHRVPLLVIGKSEMPRCIEDLKNLPVIYKHSGDETGMKRSIFLDWYKNIFISNVREHQERTGITGKVVLIIDNAPSHSSAEDLNSIEPSFEVILLPPNVTALVQPQSQGIISTTKTLYKKALLRKLLLEEDCASADNLLKEFNLKDALDMLAEAWSSLEEKTLRDTWKPLLGDLVKETDEIEENKNSLGRSTEFVRKFLMNNNENSVEKFEEEEEGYMKVMEKAVRAWLLKDADGNESDCGWEAQSDFQISAEALNGEEIELTVRPSCVKIERESEPFQENCEFQEDESHIQQNVSSQEAYECFKKIKIWMQTRAEFKENDFQTINKFASVAARAKSTQVAEYSFDDSDEKPGIDFSETIGFEQTRR